MKNTLIIISILGICFADKSIKKYNKIHDRYDIINSDGTKCTESYSKIHKKWIINCSESTLEKEYFSIYKSFRIKSNLGTEYYLKWNPLLKKYESDNSSRCYEKYNELLNVWESTCEY